MFLRRSPVALALCAVIASTSLGCGPSQEEYQAKVSEVASLTSKLEAERTQNKKGKADLEEAAERIEQLKKQLSAAGVDISNLSTNQEQQARALEDYRRREEQLQQIKKRFDLLRDKLQPLGNLGLVVTTRENRVVIQVPGDKLFDAGKEALKKEGQEILLKVAEVIRNDKGLSERSFQVGGHTDDTPPKGGKLKDNWSLSLMRAREVVLFLVQPEGKNGGGLKPSKWSAAGYGETNPLKPNDSPESKQANRRCEIVVLPNVDEVPDLKSLVPAPAK